MAFSKVIFNGTTLIDLTQDTAEQPDVLSPKTFHLANGEQKTGSGSGGGSVTLQTKSKTYVLSESSQSDEFTADTGYDGLEKVSITVPAIASNYVGSAIARESSADLSVSGSAITAPAGYYSSAATASVAAGSATTPAKTITANPTISINNSGLISSSVSGSSSITPTVVAGYVSAGTAGTISVSGSSTLQLTTHSSADLTANGATVTAPSGYYAANATKTISNGSATAPATISGTSATVSHSSTTLSLNKTVSVTPTVSAGYISSGTAGNASVSLSTTDANFVASNIKNGVSIFGLTGSYEGGGGGGGLTVATATATPSSASTSISFTNLSGEPTSFIITSAADLATGASPYKTSAVVFDGTNLIGQEVTNTSNAQVTYVSSGWSKSYSNGTLTVTGTGTNFQANQYKLIYTYGGSDISTVDVQVGSGATSITFTGLEEEPSYFSCLFKSDFATSSGYTRTMVVAYDGTDTYGMEMGSGGQATTHWSFSYSNGSLTISSQSTTAGGYFHQPGYYQLTYAIEGSTGNYQTKTVTPTAAGLNVTADNGYDALKKVVVEGDADLVASNIKSGVTIFNVLGTYSGGGSGVTGVAKGTLTVASAVNTNTNTKITDTTTIGFTPKAFLFYRSDRSATSNHINQASFVTLGSSYYVRTRTRYSSNALSTNGDTNNWTTQSSGYLYFNSNTVYFRSSSSYILANGTWNWVAIQ